MLKNYLKIAFRSLWRSKLHSSINVLGLGLGIGCCLLIALFVNDEWTFDAFHTKADRIYRVSVKENWGKDQEFFNTVTPFPMGPALKDNFEEVEAQVRIVPFNSLVRAGENQFSESVTIGGQNLFSVFDFERAHGNPTAAMSSQSGVLLTRAYARKFFGTEDAVGKTLSLQLGEQFEEFDVKAVVDDLPTNSGIQFNILISDLNFPKLFSEQVLTSAWFNVNPETYVLLKTGVRSGDLSSKFPSVFKGLLGEEDFTKSKYEVGLQPLTDIHLNTSFPVGNAPVSNPMYSYILAAIAMLILFVACINFVTLSIGRAIQRSKEVGIRKVVGAARRQLVFQFIGEAIVVTLVSTVLGTLIAYLCLPLFNDLSGKQLLFPWNEFLAIVLISLLAIIGLIAGSYPAFILSSLRPVAILKGAVSAGTSRQGLRKSLVGVQLVLSIFLITSTLIMQRQLTFIQNKNLGFQKEQLAVVQLNVPRGGRLTARVNKGFEMAEQFKNELARVPGIKSVCAASHDFGNGAWTNVGFTDEKGVYRTFFLNVIDDEYVPVLGMELAQGRNFSDNAPADKRRSVIVNEAFAALFGWSDAIGKRIPGANFLEHEVVGVVKNFNYASLYTQVQPLVMVQDPAIILSGVENINISNTPLPKLLIRIKPGDMMATLEEMKSIWTSLTGGEEFDFTFADQALATQYRSDSNLGRIVRLATILAIVIGSLGLYGLASLALQNRVKEISIRKVLGASERSLALLLSKEYVYLTVVCLLISVPATWYSMDRWLQSFEYRIAIEADSFVVAGVVALTISLLTISYQLLRIIVAQPVETLKNE